MRHLYGQMSQVVRPGGCDEGEIAGRTARALYLSDGCGPSQTTETATATSAFWGRADLVNAGVHFHFCPYRTFAPRMNAQLYIPLDDATELIRRGRRHARPRLREEISLGQLRPSGSRQA